MLSKVYLGLYVKYPLFLSHFMNHESSRRIFEKYSDIKFQEDQSSARRDVLCGRKDMRIFMGKLIVASHSFVNAPRKRNWHGSDISTNASARTHSYRFTLCLMLVFLNRRAAARYRALASIIPGREWPEETTICYKISLVQLITNLNVILYLSTCHTVYIVY